MARETLLFLPGMMCDERLFLSQIKALSSDYTILVGSLATSRFNRRPGLKYSLLYIGPSYQCRWVVHGGNRGYVHVATGSGTY